jgi:hypothetical protein
MANAGVWRWANARCCVSYEYMITIIVDRDAGLERLFDLDGFLAEVGGGYWVKIDARRVPIDQTRPHGIGYSLTLHGPDGRRVLGIDNAHLVRRTRGPSGRAKTGRDHIHRSNSVRPYAYRDADTLIDDFWREVHAILRKEGLE